MRFFKLILTVSLAISAQAQTLSTSSLTGRYFARHVEFSTDTANKVTDARSVSGTMTFNGAGNYSFAGQQVIGTGTAASFTASGTYTVSPAGIATITNPQKPSLTLNARYGTEAVVGSSTEAADNTFDLFVAIPFPSSTVASASLNGAWTATDFELTGASTSQVRESLLAMTLDGAGNISSVSATGHAAGVSGGASLNQSFSGTYSLNSDGSGTLAMPLPASLSATNSLLSSATRTIAVSKSGNVILGATPGAHDIFIALRNAAPPVALATGTRYWSTGLRIDTSGYSNSYVASVNTLAASSSFLSARRLHETGFPTAINVTATTPFTLATDGTGSAGAARIAAGVAGLAGANAGGPLDPSGYEISIGVGIPLLTGTGVFVNPQGILNAAGNAPAGDAIAPGEFITIYGSGMAAVAVAAPPYPKSLGGVSVSINGIPAAINFVSPNQINCIVPYELTGTSATIVVTSNSVVSNTVTVPAASTAPGVFSRDATGTGDGAITHADNSLVSTASPAKKGEVVVMYLSGLGATATPVANGTGSIGLNSATTSLQVYVNGVPVQTSGAGVFYYQGLSPGQPGLYQINFAVPANLTVSGTLPVAILTPDAFTDEVNIAVQ